MPTTWAAEGRAIQRALAFDFASLPGNQAQVIITLDDQLPIDQGPWLTERIMPNESKQQVRALASMADLTVLVAPETTGILARLTRDLRAAGARILGSSAEAIELTGNKALFALWLAQHGVSTPASKIVHPRLGLPADTVFPAVLKPVDGAGSVDTYYLGTARTLPESAINLPMALLQPYVPGSPMSASFLVDNKGKAWLIGIGQQQVSIHDSRFEYRGGILPTSTRSDESQLIRVIESIPGLAGFVGIDFIRQMESDNLIVLEVNPRPTTSLVGLTHLLPPGNLAAAWLAAFDCPGGNATLLNLLARQIHGQDPVSFDASGSVQKFHGVIR